MHLATWEIGRPRHHRETVPPTGTAQPSWGAALVGVLTAREVSLRVNPVAEGGAL